LQVSVRLAQQLPARSKPEAKLLSGCMESLARAGVLAPKSAWQDGKGVWFSWSYDTNSLPKIARALKSCGPALELSETPRYERGPIHVYSEEQRRAARAAWESAVPWCELVEGKWIVTRGMSRAQLPGKRFPAKNAPDRKTCNDGDSVLFNGLLCSAGIEPGCTAVGISQSKHGSWWRSPRKVDDAYPDEDSASFSRDHMLGVLLYLASRSNPKAAREWWHWIENHKYDDAIAVALFGGRRVCEREANPFHTCPILWDSLGLFERVWRLRNYGTYSAMQKERGVDEDWLRCAPLMLGGSANACSESIRHLLVQANVASPSLKAMQRPTGPVLHLYAAQLVLRRKLGEDSFEMKEMARFLAQAAPDNPLFRLLHEGPIEDVKNHIYSVCPKKEAVPATSREWSWERLDVRGAATTSMLWDCVFADTLATASFLVK